MRPTPFQAYVRIRSAATSSAPTASCPASAAPSRAGRPEHIVAEVRQLADQGCKEITLLGQTVNSYKLRHGDGRTHAAVRPARRASTTSPGIERIKFVTNFPKDMTDDLLDAVRDLPKVCTYLHVPAQPAATRC